LHSKMVEKYPGQVFLDDRSGQIAGDVVPLMQVTLAPKHDRDQMTFSSTRMTTTTRQSTARLVNL